MTRTRIGPEARRTKLVTRRDLELFTEITGDQNPLHHDADLAARSRFGGLVVPGGVTSVREDKPVTGLRTTVANQDGTTVLDGTAVVWRDPAVAGAVPVPLADQPNPMPEQPAPPLEDS